MVYTVS